MGYALAKGLSCCLVGERVLFLDLCRDRYFCLRPAQEIAFRALLDGTGPGATILDQLIASGTLRPVAAEALPATCVAPPAAVSSLVDERDESRSRRHLPRAFWRLAASSIALRGKRLEQVVDAFKHAKVRQKRTSSSHALDLVAVARAYRTSALFVSLHDKCLLRSIAVARHLVDLGAAPDLVFGVRLRPFKAHCWVQLGNGLILDRIDEVRLFKPILVV